MALAFKSTLRGYSAYLEKPERQILRSLFSDVLTLLGGVSPADEPLEEDRPKLFDRFRLQLETPEAQSARCLAADAVLRLGEVGPDDVPLEEEKPKVLDRFRPRKEAAQLPEAPATENGPPTDAALWDLVGSVTDDEVQVD